MRIGSHEYANEADNDDVPKPAQSLGTLVPRQKPQRKEELYIRDNKCDTVN